MLKCDPVLLQILLGGFLLLFTRQPPAELSTYPRPLESWLLTTVFNVNYLLASCYFLDAISIESSSRSKSLILNPLPLFC